MKKYLFVILPFFLFLLYSFISHPKVVVDPNDGLSAIFTGDSGFILANERPLILNELGLSDLNSEGVADIDTVGKYYKTRQDTYLTLLENDYWQIFDIDTKNHSVEIDSTFVTGYHTCCWTSWGANIPLTRFGGYYVVRVCGQGTAYCSSSIYVFQRVNQVKNLITEWVWEDSYNTYSSLDSSFGRVGANVRFSYIYEKGTVDFPEDEGEMKMMPESVNIFDVDYTLTNGYWSAVDSTGLKKYQIGSL